MATLGEIKTRIITELSRDDLNDTLADQLAIHIDRAIEHYGRLRFWFNAAVVTFTTTPGNPLTAIPSSLRRIDRLTIPANRVDLQEVILPEVDDVEAQTQGVPAFYAYQNDYVRLSPVPAAAYTLTAYGLARVDVPASDADSNVWTNEAQDLIVNHTKMTLCRDQFRDPEGAQMAMGATQDALTRLRRETAERLRAPVRARSDAPWSRARFDWTV